MVIGADCHNVEGNQGEVGANLHSTAQMGKPNCSDMDMTQFIFISLQSGFPAHAFR